MRPKFSEAELRFLLELLADAEARVNRQTLNLQEEAEHLRLTVPELRRQLIYDTYGVYRKLPQCEDRLWRIQWQWLLLNQKHRIILRGLVLRIQKCLAHNKGRPPRECVAMQDALAMVQ